MTITITKATNLNAVGRHTNGNSKPVFCISTGIIYASVTDAAVNAGVSGAVMSCAVTNKIRTCKGKRYCFVSDVMEHLEEIAFNINAREEKAIAYEELINRENRIREANELVERRRAKCEELQAKLAKEMQLMEEAEAEVKLLGVN